MHDLGAGPNSERWAVFDPRSSVASKRFRSAMGGWRAFVLRERLFARGGRTGTEFPNRILRKPLFGCA
jgi:hypothetical protein